MGEDTSYAYYLIQPENSGTIRSESYQPHDNLMMPGGGRLHGKTYHIYYSCTVAGWLVQTFNSRQHSDNHIYELLAAKQPMFHVGVSIQSVDAFALAKDFDPNYPLIGTSIFTAVVRSHVTNL